MKLNKSYQGHVHRGIKKKGNDAANATNGIITWKGWGEQTEPDWRGLRVQLQILEVSVIKLTTSIA